MKLMLDNIGIIKDSAVLLDGLTVITGKNSSGKTTVGKVVYSLISAGSNVEESFEDSKRKYIESTLIKTRRSFRIGVHYSRIDIRCDSKLEEVFLCLVKESYRRYSPEELDFFLHDAYDAISAMTYEEYCSDFFRRIIATIRTVPPVESFESAKAEAILTLQSTLDLLDNPNLINTFVRDRTTSFLKHEFADEVKPVRNAVSVANLQLTNENEKIADITIDADNLYHYSNDSSLVYPFDGCVFIDNPYVVDNLDTPAFELYKYEPSNDLITDKDIPSHNDILRNLIKAEPLNFFENLELQNKYKTVYKEINEIVPGEFTEGSDGYYYSTDSAKLHIQNLATGSKMFFIIKRLLTNGFLKEKAMLILDEPESHLHPEWINSFAQILVLLIKNIGITVLLTTHSPNLLLALDTYSKTMDISEKSHFYLAKKADDGYFSNIVSIDGNIGEGYSHLSLPLIKMNMLAEKQAEVKNHD